MGRHYQVQTVGTDLEIQHRSMLDSDATARINTAAKLSETAPV